MHNCKKTQDTGCWSYSSKINLYNANIFHIIFLRTRHRFMFSATKYFAYILITFMNINNRHYVWHYCCVASVACLQLTNRRHTDIRCFVCFMKHKNYDHNPLVSQGWSYVPKFLYFLCRHDTVVYTWIILYGAHCCLLVAEHKHLYIYFSGTKAIRNENLM
jgi:hypothetical protein